MKWISSPVSAYTSSKSDMPVLQMPHQLAQKLRTTGLPRRSESQTWLPSRSSTVKSGAGCKSSPADPCDWPLDAFAEAGTGEWPIPLKEL